MCQCIGADTCIVLYQLQYSVKLGPRGDVVATVVEFANLIMLDVVPFVVIPVTDRQRVSTWVKRVKWSCWCRQVCASACICGSTLVWKLFEITVQIRVHA